MIKTGIFAKIVSLSLVSSFLFLAPLQVLSVRGGLAYSQVYAQGEASSQDGQSGGVNVSSGRDPTSDFGGYTPDQVMGSPSLAQALTDAGSWVSGLAGFFGARAAVNFDPVTGEFEVSRSRSFGVIEGLVMIGGIFFGTTVVSFVGGVIVGRVARAIDQATGTPSIQVSYSGGSFTLSTTDPNTGVTQTTTEEVLGEDPESNDWVQVADNARADLDRRGESLDRTDLSIRSGGGGSREGRVARGGNVTLDWSADSDANCVGSGGAGWTGSKTPSGSQTIENITKSEGFFLVCSKTVFYPGAGDNAPDSAIKNGIAYVEVQVDERVATSTPVSNTAPAAQVRPATTQTAPTTGSASAEGLSISVTPASVAPGGSVQISWFVNKTRSCSFVRSCPPTGSCPSNGDWPADPAFAPASAGQDASGITSVYGITQTTTYGINCVGDDGGNRSVSAIVQVAQ